jgi:hypothetical protein
MNPNLLIPGQHHSTHSHTRHADHKHSRSRSHEHRHEHRREHRHEHKHDQSHHRNYNQGQGQSRRQDHSHDRSHSQTPRPRRDSSSRRPFFTSGAHVQPLPIPSPSPSEQPQQRGRQPPLRMPPSTPVHFRTASLPGKLGHLPVFQYSKCNGRKKALCVSISVALSVNLSGTDLVFGAFRSGSTTEANRMNSKVASTIRGTFEISSFAIGATSQEYRHAYRRCTRNQRQLPTRKNIIDAMRWLVRDARCHDALFFHCEFSWIHLTLSQCHKFL